MIKDAINTLISGSDLSDVDIKEVFDEILSGLADEVLTSSFITSLKIKSETTDEIVASISASREAVKKISLPYNSETLFEVVSFGCGDDFIDISFALDIICAANGLGAVKYSFNSPFFENKSFKTSKQMGVNLKEPSFDFSNDFEKTNFAYISLPLSERYFKYTNCVSRKLDFKNILKITDLMLNPYCAKNQFVGLNSKDSVERFANICLRLNNYNTIVLSGENYLPFASIEGETFVAEAWKNKIFTYIITPDLVGLKPASLDEIKCENNEHNVEMIKNIFQNKTKGAPYDIIILNAALALYIAKKADSIMDGILLARKTIDDGLCYQKLEQIISVYS